MITQRITEKSAPADREGDRESEALLNELQSMAASLGAADKKTVVKETAEQAAPAGGVNEPPAKEMNAAPAKIKSLHWHFQYSEKPKDDGFKKELQGAEGNIQKGLAAKETLFAAAEALKQKIRQVEFGKQYSKKEQEAKANELQQTTEELRKKEEELAALVIDIKRLKEEKQDMETLARQSTEDRRRKGADRKGKLLDAIQALDVKLDYQNYDILAFTATGEKCGNALQQILFISPGALNDFTANIPSFPDKEQRVSIYMSGDSDSTVHWHAKGGGGGTKADLFNAIRELGGSIEYRSNELVVLSIPSSELKNLRVRIQAMRITLTEYGAKESKDSLLSSGPVIVSIYFTN
jgi:hypothetical protein